jgi:hypothetical protein
MASDKDEIRRLLDELPNDCTVEDVQYHLFVIGKDSQGITRATTEGTLDHAGVEATRGHASRQWRCPETLAV